MFTNSLLGVMRVIITSRQTLTPLFKDVLLNLVGILNEICKNPSNPSFDQYCFESISALLRRDKPDIVDSQCTYETPFHYRFVVAGSPPTLDTFEAILFQPVQIVLQQDIDRELEQLSFLDGLTLDSRICTVRVADRSSDAGNAHDVHACHISRTLPSPHHSRRLATEGLDTAARAIDQGIS
jgi:hypothetical protein